MKTTIIIPTLQTEKNLKYLKLCVSSILKNSTIEHDIIIGTNKGEQIELPEELRKYKRIHNVEQGQCKIVNRCVDEVETESFLLVDDDMAFPPQWEKMLDEFEGKDFLCGQLMEHGRQGSAFLVNDCGATVEEFDQEKFEKDALEMREEKIRQGFGFPILMKKSLWQKVEGYNEELDPWGSNCDSFLQLKLILAGIPMRQYLGSLFYHFQCISGTFTLEEAQPYWTKNTNYFPQFFGFGRASQPNIWSCEFIIPLDKLKYKQDWMDLSRNNPHIQPDETYNESIECPNCRFNYLKFRNPNGCPKCHE